MTNQLQGRDLILTRIGELALRRLDLAERLRAPAPTLRDFEFFWLTGLEMAQELCNLGELALAKRTLILLFESWCEWAAGDHYHPQLRAQLSELTPKRLKELEGPAFVKLTHEEHFHLFYLMTRCQRPILKIS